MLTPAGPLILWHVATAVAAVALVFGDPRFDYRLLVVGAVLPMLDGFTGDRWIMHSLAFSVALVIVVMIATVGRRTSRKRLLALPIGTMLYLVFSASWNDTGSFWWPATGWGRLDDHAVPFVERGWLLTVVLELIGAGLIALGWRRARLGDARRRRRLLSEGQLEFVVN